MIRKHGLQVVLVIVGAMFLAGIAAQVLNGYALAQEGQPGAVLVPAVDVGPGFTYQGSLQQSGVAFDGICDFEFRLFGTSTAGTQIGTTQTRSGQAVSKGRFTTDPDFGANAFDGQARWLAVSVRCPSGSGGFTTLSPRQPLTAAPYALSLKPGAVVTGNVSSSAGILNLTNNGSGSGITINSAGNNGVQVQSATGNGVQVDQAGDIGVHVGSASTGVQVDSASGVGLAVGSAPRGMYVASASLAGLQVDQADLGVFVANARNGFLVGTATENGVQVNSAVNGVVVNAATSWAGFFNGPIFSTTCTGCLMATFGINTGATALASGDIVAIRGTRSGDTIGQPMLMEVGPARVGDPVVGVVYGRGELVADTLSGKGETKQLLAPREGAVKPGDYVQIIIYGPVQVKASALGKTIAMGDKLTINDSGAARALQTVEISGVRLAESAPTIGMALESLEASKTGLIWVLVNPQ